MKIVNRLQYYIRYNTYSVRLNINHCYLLFYGNLCLKYFRRFCNLIGGNYIVFTHDMS